MNYWIFKCNPKYYRLDGRMLDENAKITWRVTRYKDRIKPGDIAFIWQTGNDRGIRAAIKITSKPQITADLPTEKQYWIRKPIEECRVQGRLFLRCKVVSYKILKVTKGLENLKVFAGKDYKQATNYKVTQAEGKILMELVNEKVTNN